jgi:6-phosphogluconolactonase
MPVEMEPLELEVLPTEADVAERAAAIIERNVRADIQRAGRATVAVSGGRTPWLMLEGLDARGLDWERIDLFQVDERVAPLGNADRNATHAAAVLGAALRTSPRSFHWMPVEDDDLDAAAAGYAAQLRAAAGTPPVLGTIHLGLGVDGHTASIFPGSPVLEWTRDVAVAPAHLGRLRMTLTLATLNRARRIVWVVTGREKADALEGLLAGDGAIVASRVRRAGAIVIADAAARPTR